MTHETKFKFVPIGARFVFNPEHIGHPHCILVRTRRGYRHETGGRQFKWPARNVVFRLLDANAA